MKWLYYRFIYRRLMTLAHRFNWHHTRTYYPDGDTLLRCDWCGLTYVKERRQPVIQLSPEEERIFYKALRPSTSAAAAHDEGEKK